MLQHCVLEERGTLERRARASVPVSANLLSPSWLLAAMQDCALERCLERLPVKPKEACQVLYECRFEFVSVVFNEDGDTITAIIRTQAI